jgi:hypothetical protein
MPTNTRFSAFLDVRIAFLTSAVATVLCAAVLLGVSPNSALATASLESTDVPTGANVPIGFALFPPDNPWNTDISGLPVQRNSATYLASVGLDTEVHPDFGTEWLGAPNGIPYVVVRGTQPKMPITFYYPDESDPGPYPIPLDAPIEGGPSSTGDRHILTLDADNHLLYEVYDARYNSTLGRWEAGSGAIWDLSSNALRPDGWTSADAAGLPMLPGLVRYDEVQSGEITHALRFTVSDTQRAYVYPATHFASDSTDPSLPPMGLRLRLKASYDISGFPSEVQVILRALKKYGMIVADNGGPLYISGAPDPRWNDEALHEITQVAGRDFEVVETTGTAALQDPTPIAPSVRMGGTVHVRAGRTLSRWGRFIDSQGSAWTASVNYGDGHGTRRLSFNGGKWFHLKHKYTRRGTFRITVRVHSDNGLSGVARLKVAVARR